MDVWKRYPFFVLILLCISTLSCATKYNYSYHPPIYERHISKWTVLRAFELDPEIEQKILNLDPESVSEHEIRNVLSRATAPRIINIHGGIYPVYLIMKSFSEFLIEMGYPEEKIRNPADGRYSYSCYESSKKLAGIIAWYYEREGLRPMIIGHSQGGIQAVKVLYQLAGRLDSDILVWNPLKDAPEDRYTIIDPLTGERIPVTGVKVSYATAVGAGGLTRFLPNQWVMLNKLRSIPDSVLEFTGFYMGFDLIGGDLLGFGPLNKYRANGTARVRNVMLPIGYNHVTVPDTKHLAEDREIRDWINNYTPSEEPSLEREFKTSTRNILWAADVWHSIKRHWVLELQRLIMAKRRYRRWQGTN